MKLSCVSLLLPLALLLPCGAAQDPDPDPVPAPAPDGPDCSGSFRPGRDNFVLDAEEAVRDGATFLSAPADASPQDCVRACCGEPRCNLALVEGEGDGGVRTCSLFNCLHRNRFVCRFVPKAGFKNFILDSVYDKHLAGPERGAGELAPPIAVAGRDQVVRPGEQVLLNGVESQAVGDAHITDYSWKLLSGDAAVHTEKTELADQLRLSNLQSGIYVFQLTVIDSNSQSDAAKVKVVVLGPEQSDRHCLAPAKAGPCRAAFPRWFYNAATERCDRFVFGGCKGNANNFLSQSECSAACSGVTVPSERSIGPAAGEQCGSACVAGQFTCSSGCCVDEALECDNEPQCSDQSDESSCNTLNRTLTRLLDIDINEKRARCTEPPRTGPCRASLTRWYYDPLNRKCHRFTFGGCSGNDNNFPEEEACSEACHGVTERHVFARGMFERFEEEESESGSIAVAVILAVAILAALAVLAYCVLKSRRDRARRAAATVATTAAALPEEQDTLVYNSTTKPV
ncbi:kunitz-type protease inhibitor 1b isoform X1 [Myripristis murdjan]|uniref:kunitz-type protease inhibitor 1b isoform X1 n=1 Tax=Myripristis murdjan TaxID=586833 RepID=UPI001175F478|nr:kunitz-type protease inhibitor 1-like isoform X1 [Myripristis murdjan]XP_029902576.1 kunitz-type protease inhibitor 1-like isoform X1 [Myripristis murdjan]XP_029902577.1 kunitz-type protease inhibitor 1-like isoform X1 [Myripristis murdjan]